MHPMSTFTLKKSAVALVVTSLLTITACGGSSNSPAAAAPSFGAMSIVMTADADGTSGVIESDLTISPASNEDGITKYNLYWGNGDCNKVGDAFASYDKTGENLAHEMVAGTEMPQGSDQIMVFSSNGNTEMKECISMAVTDDGGLPSINDTNLAFTDADTDNATNKVGGNLVFTEPATTPFALIDGYAIYWGSSATTKLASATKIMDKVKVTQGASITVAVVDAVVPTGATHLLIYTYEGTAPRVESTVPVDIRIVDNDFPAITFSSESFNDLDYEKSEIQGNLEFTVNDEALVDSFNVYYGDAEDNKIGAAVAQVAVVADETDYTLPISANTSLPDGATQFLIFPVDESVEKIGAPDTAAITDEFTVNAVIPTSAPASLSHTVDTDGDANQLSGEFTIEVTASEADVDEYLVYWADGGVKIYDIPLTRVATDSEQDVTFTIALNTMIPTTATDEIIVVSSNSAGESSAASLAFTDISAVPAVHAGALTMYDTDTDAAEIAGTFNITKTGTETTVASYEIYWGSDDETKLAGSTLIASVAKTGADLTHTFAANTEVPTGATHLLVLTKNAAGEEALVAGSADVALTAVDDKEPVNAADSVTFTDGDGDPDEYSGDITITAATDESDVTHYVAYWSADGSTKVGVVAAIGEVAVGTDPLVITMATGTARGAGTVAGDAQIIIFTKNIHGEMATGVATGVIADTQ